MWYTDDCLEFKHVAAALMVAPTRQARIACHQTKFRLRRDDAVAHAPEVKLNEYQTAK